MLLKVIRVQIKSSDVYKEQSCSWVNAIFHKEHITLCVAPPCFNYIKSKASIQYYKCTVILRSPNVLLRCKLK